MVASVGAVQFDCLSELDLRRILSLQLLDPVASDSVVLSAGLGHLVEKNGGS